MSRKTSSGNPAGRELWMQFAARAWGLAKKVGSAVSLKLVVDWVVELVRN